ncbi:allophanate hydrolase subunit 1 [Rhodobacteraceae bacterium 63075]|nr:allophanate hydrolase subunit 1 [Rhodobacteraceae bacterium 63075]
MGETQPGKWPVIREAGFDGLLVSFGERLGEPANRAALAFRVAVEAARIGGVSETSTSLVSVYLRFDPLNHDHPAMRAELEALLSERDWYAACLPEGRRLWRIPTVYGGDQLAQTARAAGMSADEAVKQLSATQVRVQTIGFMPGMPYLGELPEAWDIPRQTELTAEVPKGGLCVAIRQLVLFPVATPTGWRQIGQTDFELFRPESAEPFVLRAGDEAVFEAVDELGAAATCEEIT